MTKEPKNLWPMIAWAYFLGLMLLSISAVSLWPLGAGLIIAAFAGVFVKFVEWHNRTKE